MLVSGLLFISPAAQAKSNYFDIANNVILTTGIMTPIVTMFSRLWPLYVYYHDLRPTCHELKNSNSTFNTTFNGSDISPLYNHCIGEMSTMESLGNLLLVPTLFPFGTIVLLVPLSVLLAQSTQDNSVVLVLPGSVLCTANIFSIVFDSLTFAALSNVDNWMDIALENNTEYRDSIKTQFRQGVSTTFGLDFAPFAALLATLLYYPIAQRIQERLNSRVVPYRPTERPPPLYPQPAPTRPRLPGTVYAFVDWIRGSSPPSPISSEAPSTIAAAFEEPVFQ